MDSEPSDPGRLGFPDQEIPVDQELRIAGNVIVRNEGTKQSQDHVSHRKP